ncbi:MAG: chaperone modulatory protein CbpM [Thermoleophilaceae bacterium]|jgi:chaperone modulatory protein CbpM|nr:chaperone modulatory protein CbpM [Thermoleophilaceae bacterium]MEA2402894.1 chaperone modulatory protein CbpM [Thermoleophilaceae bacterium]
MPATVSRVTVTSLAQRRAPGQLGLESLANETGLHPDLVRRLVRLGALDPSGGTRAAPLFPRDSAARLARVVRLRRDLGVGYAGAILAAELLARIDELEAQLRRNEPRRRPR